MSVEKGGGIMWVRKLGIKKEQPTLLFQVLVWVYDQVDSYPINQDTKIKAPKPNVAISAVSPPAAV